MAFAIYKSGQGYWTRTMTAVGVGILVLTGVKWLWDELTVVQRWPAIYVQAITAVAVIAVFGALTFFVLNKPRIADFMIATEQEMKKVNWPSRKEIIGSTWVVIVGVFLFATILFVVDLIFLELFRSIGILQG
jgi:preprotein translocase subunit SecE